MMLALSSPASQTEQELQGTLKWSYPVALPGHQAVTVGSIKPCSQAHAEPLHRPPGASVGMLLSAGQALEGTSEFRPVKPLPFAETQALPLAEKQATCKLGKDLRNVILKQTFDGADKDKSGRLSKRELGLLLRRVMPQMSGTGLNSAWLAADADHDGSVTFEEFLEWLESEAQAVISDALTRATGDTGGAMLAIFGMWDTDKKGTITRERMHRVIGKTGFKLSARDFDQLFDALDKDNDGTISYQEFTQFIFPPEE
ncbi:unnamed protein product [Polarella glacialis]|uniref:EF-hand domain-containing protein n=1 Tax=Polarella glacialis TaxID=89957 RepID=A0A813HCQ7_POLGL|nr:unnamed protein product [Polarella glacialis]